MLVEPRYRFPMPLRLEVWLLRRLRHVIDNGPSAWSRKGRLEYSRLESLAEVLEEAVARSSRNPHLSRREASTLLAWMEHLEPAYEADTSDSKPCVWESPVHRLEYMLGLRQTLPGTIGRGPTLQRFAHGAD